MSLKSELQEILLKGMQAYEGGDRLFFSLEDTTQAILDLLDKSLPSHKRQVHVEHGEIMPSVAQCKWYFDGYDQALADVRKVIKED